VHYAKGYLFPKNVDLSVIARGTLGIFRRRSGEPGERISAVAARQNRKFVAMVDFEMSKDKVLMGVERRSMICPTKKSATPRITRPGTRWWRR